MNLPSEIRVIPFQPNYGASADGRVWRIRKSPTSSRSVPYEITQRKDRYGYLRCRLSNRDFMVARAVLAAFGGNCPVKGMHAAHWNGDRLDNRPENLRWATAQENIDDKKRHGTLANGERNNNAVLTRGDVEWIRAYPRHKNGRAKTVEMARRLKVARNTIHRALRGEDRKSVV